MATSFIKMHGLGNDFVIFDARRTPMPFTLQQLRAVADRRFGIGCDQVILLEAAPAGSQANLFMRIYNPDGSEAGACGNATRCIAWLLHKETGREQFAIMTKADTLQCRITGKHEVEVDMGEPRFDWRDIPLTKAHDTLRLPITEGKLSAPVAVSMGNPHAVFFVGNVDAIDLAALGPVLEHHPLFPERANISIAHIPKEGDIALHVWERGAGLTLACGTAACATLVAAVRLGLSERARNVQLPGGRLGVVWHEKTNRVLMNGAVAKVFEGEWLD